MKALWLVSWYPSHLAPFNGDFIQRHARAVSLYDDVDVIYVVRDEKGLVTKEKLVERTQNKRLNETIIYYYLPRNPISFLDKILSEIRYRRYFKEAIKTYFKQKRKPDIVHLHVSLKAGPIAKWIKKKYKIDFLLTEHWTGFLPEAKDEFKRLHFYQKKIIAGVINKAKAISTVSNYLAAQLKKISARQVYVIIPNVVDTSIFHQGFNLHTGPIRFLHISNLGYQKNPEDILKAFAVVKQIHTNFRLDIFGPENSQLVELVKSLDLSEYINFYKEVPQKELAEHMRISDALLLYSRYETFGCVIIEANACGLPVIVSDILVMHENVSANVNGLFVEGENYKVLADTISAFIRKEHRFDHKAISDFAAKKYGYVQIGMIFHDWYQKEKNLS